MLDKKKLYRGLQCCVLYACRCCPYSDKDTCGLDLANDLKLLIEPVSPIVHCYDANLATDPTVETEYTCPECGYTLYPFFKFCPNCGKEIKWQK